LLRPSLDAWLQRVRNRKRAAKTRISGKQRLSSYGAGLIEHRASCEWLLALQPPKLLHVQTPDRVAYLSGQVDTEVERFVAESLALEVAGVRRVVNSINFSHEGDERRSNVRYR